MFIAKIVYSTVVQDTTESQRQQRQKKRQRKGETEIQKATVLRIIIVLVFT